MALRITGTDPAAYVKALKGLNPTKIEELRVIDVNDEACDFVFTTVENISDEVVVEKDGDEEFVHYLVTFIGTSNNADLVITVDVEDYHFDIDMFDEEECICEEYALNEEALNDLVGMFTGSNTFNPYDLVNENKNSMPFKIDINKFESAVKENLEKYINLSGDFLNEATETMAKAANEARSQAKAEASDAVVTLADALKKIGDKIEEAATTKENSEAEENETASVKNEAEVNPEPAEEEAASVEEITNAKEDKETKPAKAKKSTKKAEPAVVLDIRFDAEKGKWMVGNNVIGPKRRKEIVKTLKAEAKKGSKADVTYDKTPSGKYTFTSGTLYIAKDQKNEVAIKQGRTAASILEADDTFNEKEFVSSIKIYG